MFLLNCEFHLDGKSIKGNELFNILRQESYFPTVDVTTFDILKKI